LSKQTNKQTYYLSEATYITHTITSSKKE